MTLSEEQRQAVRGWLAEGASLPDVQRNLKSDFGIALTYMDVRLLVLEIGAEVKDKPEPKPPPKPVAPPPPQPGTYGGGMPDDAPYDDAPYPDEDDAAGEQPLPPPGSASVSVTLDAIVVPGAMVSGTVVFSDGVKARWVIDRYGRFGLEPETEGYRPSQEDMQAFQMQLRAELQRKGYA